MCTEWVSCKQWENYAKRIERKNLREKGTSLTFSSIERRAYPYVVEVRPDQKVMLVKVGWREAMRNAK